VSSIAPLSARATSVDRLVWSLMSYLSCVPTPTGAIGGTDVPRGLGLALREIRARTLVDTTEPTRSRPVMMLMTFTVTPSSRSALGDDPDEQDPGEDAVQRPRPPKMETPPSRHGGDDLQLEARGVVAAGAAEAQGVVDAGQGRHDPDRTNSRNFVRATSTPVKWAASLLSPMS
jgi:hypothetical protein